MNLIFEILNCLAAIAAIGAFARDLWREHKHRRMAKGDNEETGGNRSL